MSWFFFFMFCVGGLNSLVVWSLLKKAGVEAENFLVGGLLALFSACVCYDIATKDLTPFTKQRSENVFKIPKEHQRH